jgi:hypothetical protein
MKAKHTKDTFPKSIILVFESQEELDKIGAIFNSGIIDRWVDTGEVNLELNVLGAKTSEYTKHLNNCIDEDRLLKDTIDA